MKIDSFSHSCSYNVQVYRVHCFYNRPKRSTFIEQTIRYKKSLFFSVYEVNFFLSQFQGEKKKKNVRFYFDENELISFSASVHSTIVCANKDIRDFYSSQRPRLFTLKFFHHYRAPFNEDVTHSIHSSFAFDC